jgi:hypothetical protein
MCAFDLRFDVELGSKRKKLVKSTACEEVEGCSFDANGV